MKTLSIVWKVITNILTVVVVLGIFSVAYTDFETVVLAVLVLIYLSISSFMSMWAIYQIEFSEALDNEFKIIKNMFKSPVEIYENYKEAEEEKLKQREEKKKNIMIKFYINAGFQTILYTIALYNLLTVI